MSRFNSAAVILIILAFSTNTTLSFKTRSSTFSPKKSSDDKPKLVLIGGCTGTGKSTFGMSVALDQGILKCVSTDTIRAVMRSFIPKNISPPLHRSSYASASDHDDAVESWMETCSVLDSSVEELVTDSIRRRQGLVLEGVSIAPSTKLIEIWEAGGGVATGCLLTVSNAHTHKFLLRRRGDFAGEGSEQKVKDEKKIASFDRIRKIQDEMVKLARKSNWIVMEQKVEIDPLEIIANQLEDEEYTVPESADNVNNGGNKPVPNVNKSKEKNDVARDDH
eukprot:CAMPEP_0198277962 /NCGR_PEP_ID=MMETSP1447-20131203/66132_1 /TAXON_ID=420782 /ORGANISM="Chaetoceros dichaeta, Strain CCMP1751" /LENGTH=277 /DNA_ID=CAMNT_0043973023 /DNA_START=15 /DNA_END=848 /DNA_ORIENTATION=-